MWRLGAVYADPPREVSGFNIPGSEISPGIELFEPKKLHSARMHEPNPHGINEAPLAPFFSIRAATNVAYK